MSNMYYSSSVPDSEYRELYYRTFPAPVVEPGPTHEPAKLEIRQFESDSALKVKKKKRKKK